MKYGLISPSRIPSGAGCHQGPIIHREPAENSRGPPGTFVSSETLFPLDAESLPPDPLGILLGEISPYLRGTGVMGEVGRAEIDLQAGNFFEFAFRGISGHFGPKVDSGIYLVIPNAN